MDNLAYKFTDTDIREDPALFHIAYNFIATYAGEFDFLVHARAQYLATRELPLGTVRGVLNCIRTLPNARELLGHYMWSPRPIMTAATLGRHLHAVHDDEPPRRTWSDWEQVHEIEQRSNRPARMYPKATFKAPYFLSIHPQAFVTHLLDPVKSEVVWWPRTGELEVRPTSYCSSRLSYGVMCLHDGGRQHCRQCTCLKEERSR